jgi:NADH-quinone oxidoreductase subunit L
MQNYLWLIPFFPLVGFIINGLLGRKLGEKVVSVIGAGVVFASFAVAILTFLDLLSLPPESRVFVQTLYPWMATGNFGVDIGFRIDALSIIMAMVVTGVGFLIHLYSIGYMHGERGFARYFAFLNLFTFAMLLLVTGSNFLVLFIGWEGVGLCSYLLIGYYYDRIFDETTGLTCAGAGTKAFIVNRIGDFGFLLGIFLIFATFGSLDFEAVFKAAQTGEGVSMGVLTAIALLLFVGATGKSAQLPLYVWLPDAMAGPTPVSALIHAATMVTAGVYMVARCSVLYQLAPIAMEVVAVVGVATAIYAATIALTSTDIKKVLAYSTISQLGYMFLACGVGAFAAGIFHLVTHAFFKALLFLGAGSVMHALSGETQLPQMGGLKKYLPTTFWTFLVGGLAIAGIPGLAGFFSKDEILWKAFSSPNGSPALYTVALIAAGLTAFYIFRMIYLAFYGAPRMTATAMAHLHESPRVMTVPLIVLAILSIVGGYVGVPHLNKIGAFLEPVFARFQLGAAPGHTVAKIHEENLGLELMLMLLSVIVALAGIYLASRIYLAKPGLADKLALRLRVFYNLLVHKYYVDEIYNTLFVRPFYWLSEKFFWKFFDVKIVDGTVNGTAEIFGSIASVLRRWQTGIVQNYAVTLVVGLIIILGYLLVR